MTSGSRTTFAVIRIATFRRYEACAGHSGDKDMLNRVAMYIGIAFWAMGGLVFAQTQANKIPNFASSSFAWLSAGADWINPPGGIRGPIQNDPDHPFHGNTAGPG